MKRILIPLLIVLVLIIGVGTTAVTAKDNQTNGTPFDEIWAAIKGLQHQIDTKTSASYGEWLVTEPVSLPPVDGHVIPFSVCVSGDLEGFDTETHRFTALETGIYNITATIRATDNGDGDKRVLSLSGSQSVTSVVYLKPVTALSPLPQPTPLYYITWTGRIEEGKSVTIMIKHDSTGDIVVQPTSILHITKLFNLE